MTQKKKTGISRLLEFGGCYRWMTVAYAVPIFVYLAGFTGCTGSLARLKLGKCGGNDPLWMDGSWFGSRRFSSLFVSSFIFPFGCVPHGQKYAVSDTAPSGFALIRLFLPEQ